MRNFGNQLRSSLIVRDGFLNPDTANLRMRRRSFSGFVSTPLRKMIQNLPQNNGTGNRFEKCVVDCGLRIPGKWRT